MKYPYTSKRVGACLIDYTFVFALTLFYIVYFGNEDTPGHYSVHGLPALLPVCLWLVYFVVAETFGGTVGHRIFKLKVVTMEGTDLSFGRVLIRRLCDAMEISWCFGFIAFLLVKNTPLNQRLGDIVAKTRVIGEGDLLKTVEFDFESNAGSTTTHPHQV